MSGRDLTDREQQVLQMLADGHTERMISRQLGVSERTVWRRTASVLAKLGARTAAHAVAVAYRRGLLTLGPRAGYRLALVPFT